MSIAQRFDIGRRGAGSKAQMPDEFLTRSQVIPGTNIWFEYLANWDIKIHANTVGGAVGISPRFLVATVELSELPPDKDAQRYLQRIAYGNAIGSATDRLYFGTSYYINIRHDWNLVSPHHYLFAVSSINDETIAVPPEYNDLYPRVIGVDKNTVQIQGSVKPGNYYDRTIWTDNDKTQFLEPTDWDSLVAPQGLYDGPPVYVIRLQEIIDPLVAMTGIEDLETISNTLGV